MIKGCKHYATKVMKYEDGGIVVKPGKPYVRGADRYEKYRTTEKYSNSARKDFLDAFDKNDSDRMSKDIKIHQSMIDASKETDGD